MYKFLCFCILLHTNALTFSSAQTDKTKKVDQIIEGGKVVVDLVKVIKGDNNNAVNKDHKPDCENSVISTLCFENQGNGTILITLHTAGTPDDKGLELIIPAGEKECNFSLRQGLYDYEVKRKDTAEMLRKGQLQIEPCKDIVKVINNQK